MADIKALLLALALLPPALCPAVSLAERTPLLRVDLKTGERQRIDRGGEGDSLDRELDTLLDDATGKRFSTADLERVERALRGFLRARRPRSAPRLLLFLYPGRITQARLKELREVVVDVDLLVDPCPRSVCRDSLGKHLEVLGHALGKPRLRAGAYAIRFGSISLRAQPDGRSGESLAFSFPAQAVIDTHQSRAGRALITKALAERSGYGQAMTKAIGQRIRARGVRLEQPPLVVHGQGTVEVTLSIASDRVRYKGHVLAALLAAMQALRASDITPKDVRLAVEARGTDRRDGTGRFRCKGYPLALHLDGRIGQRELWTTYVIEEQRSGRQLSFADDADGDDGDDGAEQAVDRTEELLAENIQLLAPCLQTEAQQRRSFSGVTLQFEIDGAGRATRLRLKEPRASARLKQCLERALDQVRFQSHGGAPRKVSYPMFIRR